MTYSLPVDVEPEFNLFAMTRDLRNYLHKYYNIPVNQIEHVFLWGSRIDFSLKPLSDYDQESDWYIALVKQAC